ncbi:MAG TPA: RidA family protein [Vicinamibacteria bacterium]|nr:RidA family protein [Vicinamibacteria bacterium]
MKRCFFLWLLALAAASSAAEKKIIAPEGMEVGLPFSPAVLSGDFLYLAGAIGNKPGTLEVPDGIQAQVRQAMDNLGQVLEAAGMDFSRVVSSNVFLSDARHFSAMNDVYKTYFPEAPPIRATVEADIAIPGALVEISMIAARPGVDKKVIKPSLMKSPELPYSWGVQVGSTLFVAGATARDPDTYVPVAGDMKTQTKRVLENIGLVLEAAGMSYGDVVGCKVFLDDARYFQDMNEVYRTFFPADPPSRATVRSRLMNPAFLSEIQCTAVKDAARKVVSPAGRAPSTSPLSSAVAAGGRLFLSGMTGRGPDGYPKGDAKAQTRQALESLKATLEADGLGFEDVVDVLVYLSDIRYYDAMNEVYRDMISLPPPARATVGAQLMSEDALVEIIMTAERR